MMNRKWFTVILAALFVLLLSVGGATGQGPVGEDQPRGEVSIQAVVNSRISYQGVLKEDGGPVTGSRDITFRFYSDDACSSQVGSDVVKSNVAVANGLFSVELDVAHGDFDGRGLWLEAEVGGSAIGCWEIMPVPYALSLRPGAIISGTLGGTVLSVVNGTADGYTYGVYGQADSTLGRGLYGQALATSGANIGVYGRTNSDSGSGVQGVAAASSGLNAGVYGQSASVLGRGVYGYASATTGDTNGVYGESDSVAGQGVFGLATASSGTNFGVLGMTASDEGRGVGGLASSDSGASVGVYGMSQSTEGVGVYGIASATSGEVNGVYGTTPSNAYQASGVFGQATATDGYTYGVRGESASPDGRGVYGYALATTSSGIGVFGLSEAITGSGVRGIASGSGLNYGVYGRTSSAIGYGVYYHGGLGGTGLKTSIVETADYGWRHLYSVESTGPWFEDFGSGQLVDGRAVVAIDALFAQTVNSSEDYYVFLTPRGDCGGLYVAAATATSFEVRELGGGSSDVTFDYRIVAKRLGYEDVRMAPAADPAMAVQGPELEP